MITAERLVTSKQLSVELEAPVAGKMYHDGRYPFDADTSSQDPSTIITDYKVIRQVFYDAELSLPVPATIQEA